MGFKIKSKFGKVAKRILHGGGLSTKQYRSIRKHLGLTSKNKWVRQVKRSLGLGKGVAYTQPVSANDVAGYQYSGRSVSQLMGGV